MVLYKRGNNKKYKNKPHAELTGYRSSSPKSLEYFYANGA